MPAKEYGVFLPIGNGGWMVSTTAPHPAATYAYNRQVALDAEAAGLDFIMTMAKWKGFGGTTDHWGETLESMTMMSALAECTERVKIWATMHANMHHPAVAAKMYTTLQQISGGRAGMNIVNGSYADEFSQMGLWQDMPKEDRYRMTAEWCEAVTRLWTEDRVTMESDFFTLVDAESRPHPDPRPTIINAGASTLGMEFQARYADGAFLGADSFEEMVEKSAYVHRRAGELGRECRTYSMMTVVLADTDDAARAKVAEYGRGVDREALLNMSLAWGVPLDRARAWAEGATGEEAFQVQYVAGSPATVTESILRLVEDADLDGLMLIFPDYHADLPEFGRRVLPELRAADLARTAPTADPHPIPTTSEESPAHV
ncbi:LLM class flavin-dependent oxidoreductase [Nocardioides daeguensis]|uniref:LLM class flavin-dependent oxidoreductase n=1 Tax=Nocardioides daeguensis TaxID=908359 RepID=A0ABP6W5Z8_9ACTN|nr:LLM class flavin-dependent oxidoreductase [Nocardioides daeguensis]MBV6729353.1 LLM class flavin-dependent oxidoreductase [Nocardioides daeguensis]MCR1774329.1 LLM class flavin-dependent oxidoreductase [Nocardioides daeguensis]